MELPTLSALPSGGIAEVADLVVVLMGTSMNQGRQNVQLPYIVQLHFVISFHQRMRGMSHTLKPVATAKCR